MKIRKLYIISIAVFVVGIIVGSFLDLQINQTIYSPKSPFGLIMASFGHWVGYSYLALLSGFCFKFFLEEKTLWKKLGLFVICGGSYVVPTWLSGKEVTSVNAYNMPKLTWLFVLIAAIVMLAMGYLGYKIGKKNDSQRILLAMIILGVLIVIQLVPIAQVLKSSMRRPRYRVVADDAYGYQSIFLNWWQPYKDYKNFAAANSDIAHLSENFKSFPSGHASVAAILIFGLPYLSLIEPKLKGKENLLFIIGLVFTILMSFSRMLVGAHYLSDVSFGGLTMIICCIIANEINLKFVLKD